MLNKYPLWKYLLILAVLAVGFIYSAPNLYPDDPAVQISGASTALQVTQADVDRAAKALTDAGIAVKADSLSKKGGRSAWSSRTTSFPPRKWCAGPWATTTWWR